MTVHATFLQFALFLCALAHIRRRRYERTLTDEILLQDDPGTRHSHSGYASAQTGQTEGR